MRVGGKTLHGGRVATGGGCGLVCELVGPINDNTTR